MDFNREHLPYYLLALALIILIIYWKVHTNSSDDNPETNKDDSAKLLTKLWSEHVFWMKLYIISALENLKYAEPAKQKLLHNQEQLGNAIGLIYGSKVGSKITKLLKDHVAIASQIVTILKDKDNISVMKSLTNKWHKNADEIADVLSKANTNLNKSELKDMLYQHLKLTSEEAMAYSDHDYQKDIGLFDKINNQALKMAHIISK